MENISVIAMVDRGTGALDSTPKAFRLRGIGGFVVGGVAPSTAPAAEAAFPADLVR